MEKEWPEPELVHKQEMPRAITDEWEYVGSPPLNLYVLKFADYIGGGFYFTYGGGYQGYDEYAEYIDEAVTEPFKTKEEAIEVALNPMSTKIGCFDSSGWIESQLEATPDAP